MIGVNAKSDATRRPLRVHRQIAGLTQRQLAKRVGTDPSTISDYERGAVMPSAARLREIAEVLSVTTDEIDLAIQGAD